jgi:hypothetical protein
MIEYLESAGDVLALRCHGKLEGTELDTLIDRLDAALQLNDKTHVFAEMQAFGGFDLSHLPHYLERALPMLRQLERFGRVAVVSESAWLRALTRLESALLPHVSYRTFTPDEREQALAWVEGRSPLPHGPALWVIDTDRPDVFAFELDGKLTTPEVRAVTRLLERKLADHDTLRVLGRIKRAELPELLALLDADFIAIKRRAFLHVERYAIVGGPAWLAAWTALLDKLMNTGIRHFSADAEAAAWQWLEAMPQSERSLLPG